MRLFNEQLPFLAVLAIGIVTVQGQELLGPPAPAPKVLQAQRLPVALTNGMTRPAQIKPTLSTLPQVNVAQPSPSAIIAPALQPPLQQPRPQAFSQPQPINTKPMEASIIAWDSEQKEVPAKFGDTNAHFTFWLTNISSSDVIITSIRTSCGCTVAKMPNMPWTINPGSNGPVEVSMDVRGKVGMQTKTVTVESSVGMKTLLVKANIAPQQTAGAGMGMDRSRNMQMAMADRQAPLKGDCAKCHVEPALTKTTGKELYATACSICHNAEHRAAMVPDLQNLNKPTDHAYWKAFVSIGKPGTLMPAFSKDHGGFLSAQQVDALVTYLVNDFPKEPKIIYHEPHPSTTQTNGSAVQKSAAVAAPATASAAQ